MCSLYKMQVFHSEVLISSLLLQSWVVWVVVHWEAREASETWGGSLQMEYHVLLKIYGGLVFFLIYCWCLQLQVRVLWSIKGLEELLQKIFSDTSAPRIVFFCVTAKPGFLQFIICRERYIRDAGIKYYSI